jgi:hypothetical protein
MKATRVLWGLTAFVVGCGNALDTETAGTDTTTAESSAAVSSRPVMAYHGGPIMTGTVHVYFLWYGAWQGSGTQPILRDFVNGLNGSSYYNILTTYSDGSGNSVIDSVVHPSGAFNRYSLGSALQDADLRTAITTAIQHGTLPYDTNGVYFVLTSADVTVQGPHGNSFCSGSNGFGGYHDSFSLYGDRDIKYAFVGDPSTQPCNAVLSAEPSPNGDPAADYMARLMGHEIAEAVTDPLVGYQPAWIVNGLEVGDLCEGSRAAKGYVQLGARTFWLQPLFLNNPGRPGRCVFGY